MLVNVLTVSDDRAAVMARKRGRWRPLLWFTGPKAEERARDLAGLIRRGLVSTGDVLRRPA